MTKIKKSNNLRLLKSFRFSICIFLILSISNILITKSFAHKSDSVANGQLENKNNDTQLDACDNCNAQKDELHEDRNRLNKLFNNFYFEPFFDINDISQKVEKHLSDFNEYLDNHSDILEIPAHRKSTRISVSKKENKEYSYYQLNFKDFNSDNISIEIENGILSFIGNNIKSNTKDSVNKNKKSNLESKIRSNFLYSFSLPENLNSKTPKIVKEKDKIIVKFKKN